MQDSVSGYIESFKWEHAEKRIRERAKRAFLDTIAAALAGSRMEQVSRTAEALEIELEREAERTAPVILGYGHCRASLPDAVLLNAVSAHSCEYNDLFYGLPGHPGTVLVPVVLGLGERLHKSGREILEAYLCALEILGRVNEGLMPEHHLRGFHSTSTVGIIGAAAAAGKLLKLDQERLQDAVSMACTFACGLRGNFGYTGNSLHAGNAAAGGLKAALLANAGIRARRDLMFLPDGYVTAFGGRQEKMERSLALLGQVSVLDRPGLLLKKYPVCYSAFQAIDAAKELAKEYDLSPADIESAECLTSPNHYMSLPLPWPDSIYGQRFCIPFCVCLALCGGKVTVEELSEYHAEDEELCALRERLRYGADPAQEGRTDFGSTLVRVRLKDGRTLEKRAFPRPEERLEGWSDDSIKKKLEHCGDRTAGTGGTDALWRDCMRLEAVEDIAVWMDERWKRRTDK